MSWKFYFQRTLQMQIISTTTQDGLILKGFYSPSSTIDLIIVHIHGMAGSPFVNAWYPTFHAQYPDHGHAYLVGQHRGTGVVTTFATSDGSTRIIGDAYELFEESHYDVAAWVEFARSLGYKRIILQAHSFGPSKVVEYLHHYASEVQKTNDIKALVLISPVDMYGFARSTPHFSALENEANALLTAGAENQLLSEVFEGEYLLSAKSFRSLFGEKSRANMFCYTERPHDWSRVSAISQPVLAIGGTKDTVITAVCESEKALHTLSEHLSNAGSVETRVYDGADHSFDGYAEQIIADVVAFIKTV